MGSLSKQKSSSKSKSFLPIQEDVLTQTLGEYRDRIGAGQPIFEGQRVAPFSELQQQALNLAPETFFRTPEQEQQLFQQAIEAPAQRRFAQETVPLISEAFAGPGFFGSARAQETVRAGEDLAAGLSAERAKLRQETDLLNRQGVAQLFDFGAQEQMQQQRENEAEFQKFIEETRLTNPEDIALITQLLGLNFGVSTGSSSGFSLGLEA